ncbi:hypothetical protein OCV51_01810 [Faecalicatena acetigenes]|uniref:Amino acid permease n=1 Tax=Faecalicatena acetigenes TaxID=2981790 RepID=A0ABT2T806_9FIRM|nr:MULTISPECIES: hypothetical protein [Lachnospiraceae]MCU6746403.1 hypothetical protein [Faecalicatena acetigenes]SCH16498.1 Uncharacterized membrane protein [uncultured Clostridium sp.]
MKNMGNSIKLSVMVASAFAFMTAFFGGGWATGQMANVYGVSFGWTGIIFPLIGLALICVVSWIVVEYSRLNNTWNYGAFMEKFYGTKIVKWIFDVIQIVGMPISYAVSVATFASTMKQFIGGPYLMWIVVFDLIVLVSVIWGTAVVNKLSAYMGTAILILLVVIFVTVIITGNGSNVMNMISNRTMNVSYGEAFYKSSIKLFMVTGSLALMILPSFEPVQKRSDVTKTVLLSFLFSASFIFIVCFNVQAFAPQSIVQEVPIMYAIQQMGTGWMVPIYVMIVVLAVVTTANTMGLGYCKRFSTFSFIANWKAQDRTKTIVIMIFILVISSAVSIFGLTNILSVGFTILGYLNIPLITIGLPVLGIAKLVQIRRRHYSLEKGSLEKKSSWCMFQEK